MPPEGVEVFDSNCITPGTAFMARLGAHLRFFIRHKMKDDPVWQTPRIIFSGAPAPAHLSLLPPHPPSPPIQSCRGRSLQPGRWKRTIVFYLEDPGGPPCNRDRQGFSLRCDKAFGARALCRVCASLLQMCRQIRSCSSLPWSTHRSSFNQPGRRSVWCSSSIS